MDPLSDVLALLKPKSHITAGFDAGGSWCVRFDDQTGWIKCYTVESGGCWLSVEDCAEPTWIKGGDCFVLPSGRPFRLGSDLSAPSQTAGEVFAQARRRENGGGVAVLNGGGGVFLAGSRFAVEGRYAATLLRDLPPIIHLEAERDQAMLRWSIDQMMAELRDDQPGASLAVQHLAHMMLLQALRLYLARSSAGGGGRQIGWFFALADPKISAALVEIHADPARRWTLEDLASVAGQSRSLFARRFRERVGETPIAYLTRWRMLLASERMTATRESVGQTARALGYESENAFNTAFKRVMGCPPRRFARGDAQAA